MPFASIYCVNPRIENWGSWKSQFFWVGHLFSSFIFFDSSPLNSVNIDNVSRMGQNFDDHQLVYSKRVSVRIYLLHSAVYVPGTWLKCWVVLYMVFMRWEFPHVLFQNCFKRYVSKVQVYFVISKKSAMSPLHIFSFQQNHNWQKRK